VWRKGDENVLVGVGGGVVVDRYLYRIGEGRIVILRISPIPGPPNTRISSLEEPPLSLMGIT